jgi:DNA-directed RNA polymerase specialized sigma24 family protein
MTAINTSARAGVSDRHAEYTVLFQQEKGRLYGLAFGVLRDRGEAQDAVQETLWQVWKQWDSLRDPDRRSAWVTTICLNVCLNSRKRLRAGGFWSRSDLLPSSPAPSEPGLGGDLLDLERGFLRLSRKQRAATLLVYQYGFTQEECAALMGCRPGSVRTHIARALRKLRKELAHD